MVRRGFCHLFTRIKAIKQCRHSKPADYPDPEWYLRPCPHACFPVDEIRLWRFYPLICLPQYFVSSVKALMPQAVQSSLVRDIKTPCYAISSVIIPQIKQAISLATAVFAMFTFDLIAILKYFFLYFFGNLGCKRVYFFGCVCGIENSVIFKEYYLRSFSVCFFVFAELLAAERCENVSRFC